MHSVPGAVYFLAKTYLDISQEKQLLIFVELNMQDFPVIYTDAGMAALMALVAIVTAKVLHLPLLVDSDFIDGQDSETGAIEH